MKILFFEPCPVDEKKGPPPTGSPKSEQPISRKQPEKQGPLETDHFLLGEPTSSSRNSPGQLFSRKDPK